MVKILKRPTPPKPIKNENDYRSDPNFNAIFEDCFGKCYICENGKATTLNIEHIVPHKDDNNLKFDWNNLFLSCGHCNNTKLVKYTNIINPAKLDPEEFIELSLVTENLIEKVIINPLSNDPATLETADLLEHVYNKGNTAMKKVENSNLRNIISRCIRKFLIYIKNYKEEPDLGYDKLIIEEISCSSEFASFKRKIIRDDKELYPQFYSILNKK